MAANGATPNPRAYMGGGQLLPANPFPMTMRMRGASHGA